MKKTYWMLPAVLLALMMGGTWLTSDAPALAADQGPIEQQMQLREQEKVYGSQLMTTQEREEYRARMRNAGTAEERERIRNEHHERMEERAREQGVNLPDEPPERGMGRGPGPGGGMGPGGRNR